MMAVSVLANVANQTSAKAFSIRKKDILKSIINPTPPTMTNLINEELRKI